MFELIGFGLLAAVALLGLVLRGFRIDDNRFRSDEPTELAAYDRIVPAPVLGVTLLVGLIAISIVGCFAYYPPP